MCVGAGHLFDQSARISDANRIDSKRSQSDHAEIVIAHHDRIRGAPLQVGKLLRVDKVNFGFERRSESILPCAEFCKNRRVATVDRVEPGSKHVRNLALKNKDRSLRFAHRELRAIFDLLALTGNR